MKNIIFGLVALSLSSVAVASTAVGVAAFEAGDYVEAIKQLTPQQQDPEALYLLGRMYEGAMGVGQDAKRAEQYYRAASQLGHSGATFQWAWLLEERDAKQAEKLYREAAAQGNLQAMLRLTVLTDAKPEESLHWYKAMAERALVDAQFRLAQMYEDGRGTEISKTRAIKWYTLASRQHDDNGPEVDFARTKLYELSQSTNTTNPSRTEGATLAEMAMGQAAADVWRPLGQRSKDDGPWLSAYREAFTKASTAPEWEAFIVAYEDDDPDQLVGSAKKARNNAVLEQEIPSRRQAKAKLAKRISEQKKAQQLKKKATHKAGKKGKKAAPKKATSSKAAPKKQTTKKAAP